MYCMYGSAPDISVSHRDGVACCTTQSPELKGISGGKDVFMISSSLECAWAEGRRDVT